MNHRPPTDCPCCFLPDSWRHSTPSGGDGQLGIATKSHKKGCAQDFPSRALRPLREIVPRQARQERQGAGMAGAAATSGRCHKNGKRQNGFSCTFVFFVAMNSIPADLRQGKAFSPRCARRYRWKTLCPRPSAIMRFQLLISYFQ